MKKRFVTSLLAGLGIAAVIFSIEALTSRPLLVAFCDGASIAAVALLAAGAIGWLNSDHIKHSIFDLSKSVFKKAEEDEAPTEEKIRERAASGRATLLAGCTWLAVAIILMAAV